LGCERVRDALPRLSEVEQLIHATKGDRHGQRDADMVLAAYFRIEGTATLHVQGQAGYSQHASDHWGELRALLQVQLSRTGSRMSGATGLSQDAV
jgi:hypothetical protein